jgi:hypothetical protein
MKTETLKKILDFLKQNENRNIPIAWKLINNEPLTEKELTIDRDLDLKGSTIKSLPEYLNIKDDLDLSHTKITSLPKGLKVGENLYIKNSPLTKYSDYEIIKMIAPGYIQGKIDRSW